MHYKYGKLVYSHIGHFPGKGKELTGSPRNKIEKSLPNTMKRFYTPIVFIILFALASCSPKIVDSDALLRYNPETDSIFVENEVRAVWLATVNGIDWPDPKDDASTQQTKLRNLIRDISETGCNTVYFQVVSNMDALWPSKILPWSHVLTGTQGKDPGYDPLLLAIEECRDRGLQIHAWINPLRCGSASAERSSKHVVKSHPKWIQKYKNSLYLDPSLPEVRDHLANIATELLSNYDLDGIHIDDYFYPDGLQTDSNSWDDSAQFKKTGAGKTLDEWRFSNINSCVKALSDATHSAKAGAIFGVSPGGRLVNTVRLYADPRFWVEENSIDYLIPQIYWQHGHPIADFPTVLESWKEIVKDVPMLTGLAAYRYGENGFEHLSEFEAQVSECRESPWVMGHAWFSTKSILKDDFKKLLRDTLYAQEVLVPSLGKTSGPIPGTPEVRVEGTTLRWERTSFAKEYAVYRLSRMTGGYWWAELVQKGPSRVFNGRPATNYAVLAYSGKDKSKMSTPVFIPSMEALAAQETSSQRPQRHRKR